MLPLRSYLLYLFLLLLFFLFLDGAALRLISVHSEQEAFRSLEIQARLLEGRVLNMRDTGVDGTLDNFLLETGKQVKTRITVLGPDGIVLADSAESQSRMENHNSRPEVAGALEGRVACARRYSQTLQTDMFYCAIPLMAGSRMMGVLRTAEVAPAVQPLLAEFRKALLVGGFVLAGATVVFMIFSSRHFFQANAVLLKGIERFAAGDFSIRLPAVGGDLAEVTSAVNIMAEQLGARIRNAVQEKKQMEALFASMVEGVVALDCYERVFRINQAAVRFLGMDGPGEIIGRNLLEIIRNVELLELVRSTIRSRTAMERELMVNMEAGPRFLQVHGVPLGLKQEAGGTLIVLHDVTGIRKLESVRRDFVANVSHELKTPITSIKGFVETLIGGAMHDSDDCRRFLEIIDRQTERLNEIVDDLLALSRLELDAEAGEITREDSPLKEVLELAVQVCGGKAANKAITLSVECPDTLRAYINPPLIEQVVVNLVDNAIKYSEPGKEVRILARAENGDTVISVIDQGPGIHHEHLPRLFERFYRVDKARGRKLGGSGLGLAIVKHIVQAHGGQVWVESELGRGSVFSVRIT